MLNDAIVAEFRENGFVLIPGFYDRQEEIEPIQRGIHQILGLVIAGNELEIRQEPFTPETFDSGYQELIQHERRLGGVVYDAVKQIPAFVRLVASARHEALLAQLRNTDAPAIAGGGYGIRIDNPFEEKFRAPWHQEYPAQLRSVDGIVLWSPLLAVTPEMGPVEIAVGSHREGLLPVHGQDPANPDKKGAYALVLAKEAEHLAKYRRVAPLTSPGDLLIMDFLTLHRSRSNRGARSRWSMQFRYFNFREPTGMRIGWSGSFAAGVDFRALYPELVADG
ncbi:MAG: phytanoyl-CoA dioxygenase family protein [Planctomycetota bacterium]